MKKVEKPTLKLPIALEIAYEIITFSLIFIFIGLAFIFASNLLNVNGYSIVFGLLALALLYFKKECKLEIKDDQLKVFYFKCYKDLQINMEEITEIIFHSKKRYVEIRTGQGTISVVYMRTKHKRKLLNYLVNHYPEIHSIFINTNKND